jgi:hypothetical protein
MTDLKSHLLELLLLQVFLTVAYKWTALNPYRIQDGPTWLWAALGAFYSTASFGVALVLREDHPKWAAFFGSFGFGSGIGPCFLTRFKPAPEEVPNPIMRWWIAKWESAADSAFKSVVILPIAWVVGRLLGIEDAGYWVVGLAGMRLTFIKQGPALLFHDQAPPAIYQAQQRVLIRGSVLLTMMLGVVCLIIWCSLTKSLHDLLGRVRLADYETVIGFLLGAALHIF